MNSDATKDDFDYNYPAKRHWRRWAWNRIVECVSLSGKSTRDSVVLYFPGKSDYDFEIARNHGFRRENMIGVEWKKDVYEKIKAQGHPVIHGDIFSVLKCWKPNLNIDVVHLDFCNHADPNLNLIGPIVSFPFLETAAVSLNFLAGRDSEISGYIDKNKPHIRNRHRGEAFFLFLAHSIYIKSREVESNDDSNKTWIEMGQCSPRAIHKYISTSGQRFDSIVFSNNYKRFHDRYFPKSQWAPSDESPNLRSCTRKIAAVKAVRTSRINAFSKN